MATESNEIVAQYGASDFEKKKSGLFFEHFFSWIFRHNLTLICPKDLKFGMNAHQYHLQCSKLKKNNLEANAKLLRGPKMPNNRISFVIL